MLHRIPAPRPWTSRFAWLHPKVYLLIHVVLGLALSAACGWLFGELSDAVAGRGRIVRFDQFAASWRARHHSTSGNDTALIIALFGNEILYALVALVAVGYLIRREWPRATLLIVASGGGA